MIQLSKGLEAIHEAEVVHRDIKPENIFIGDSIRLNLKIGDLGISRVIDTGTEYSNVLRLIGSVLTPRVSADEAKRLFWDRKE